MINAVSFFLMILFIGKFKRVEKSFGGGMMCYNKVVTPTPKVI